MAKAQSGRIRTRVHVRLRALEAHARREMRAIARRGQVCTRGGCHHAAEERAVERATADRERATEPRGTRAPQAAHGTHASSKTRETHKPYMHLRCTCTCTCCHVVHVHVTVCFSSCTPPIRCCRSGANHGAPPSPSRLLPAPPSPSRSLHTTNSCGASLKLKWGVARNYCFRISFENDSMINTSRYAVPRVALETKVIP